jgi:iron complex outermembrane recepter protein
VWSEFAELNVPLVGQRSSRPALDELTVSISARDDHYSDFGNAFDPQAGLVWKPIQDLTFRGSFARAFRAPDLYILSNIAETSILPYPVVTPQNAAPKTVPILFLSGGKPDLGPERAITRTAGFDYDLPFLSKTRLSMSYVDIDYRDRINNPMVNPLLLDSADYPPNLLNLAPTPQQVATALGVGPFFGNFSSYPWNGNAATLLQQIPNLAIFDDRYTNLTTERYRGLDLSLDTKLDTAVGEVSAGFNSTKTLTHFEEITPQVPSVTIFNYVGQPAGFRARANMGITHGPYSGFVFVNYTSGYANQFATPESRIASWTTVDLTLRWDSTSLVGAGPLSHVAVTASAQNLLDRDPPRFGENIYSGYLFDPANANPLGRVLGLNVVKKW